MQSTFDYTLFNDRDKQWGLYTTVVGKSNTLAGVEYPQQNHPTGYSFDWDRGRTLSEYQFVYITDGEGIYEDESGTYSVKAGSMIILERSRWHRYRPNIETGWIEHFVGFDGSLVEHFYSIMPNVSRGGVLYCGFSEDIISIYTKISEVVKENSPEFQQIASGLVIQLFAKVSAILTNKNFAGKPIERLIKKVQCKMRDNVDGDLNLPEIVERNNISYSHFRKMFKAYTGKAPNQYYIELKILKSKELLLSTNKSIKEISSELGFESTYYFSRLFKQKVGVPPSKIRE